jgi:hypothetical protein
MALTRITQNVIKDSTITEGKFADTYLDAAQPDTASQAITFESNLIIKQGAGGLTYFSADAGTGVVTMVAPDNETTVLNVSVGSISVAGNIITGGGSIGGSRVSAGDGTVGLPGFYFTNSPSENTGFYRSDNPNESIEASVAGTKVLGLASEVISLGSNIVEILTTSGNYTGLVSFDTGDNSLYFGDTNSKLRIRVDGTNTINVRGVDSSNTPYSNNEKRVGVNVEDPQATLHVGGSIRANSYQNISTDDIPVIPPSKGGTGLSTLGQSEQLIRVNTAGTGFEYYTLNTGDVNNLGSFKVSGDDSVYDVLQRDTAIFEGAPGFLRITLSNVSTWEAGQEIKLFGINTTELAQYDINGDPGNIFNTWKTNQIELNPNQVTANNTAGVGTVRYTYYAALMNVKTGVVSSLARLTHDGPAGEGDAYVVNRPLGEFNDQIYNTVPLARPIAGRNHAILLYRYIKNIGGGSLAGVLDKDGNAVENHNNRVNLIAIIGQRDIGSPSTSSFTYLDYGPFDRTTWGFFNTDGSYSSKYQDIRNIKLSYTLDDITADKPSTPGWSTRTVLDVDYDNNRLIISNSTGSNDSTSLSLVDNYNTLTYMDSEQSNFIPSELAPLVGTYPEYNRIQVVHDDTVGIQTAIQQQIQKGLRSLFLIGGSYLVRRLDIPSKFSLVGSGKATVIKKQYFDTSFDTEGVSSEYSRAYAAIWCRSPFDQAGNPTTSTSLSIEDVTIRDLVIDGNNHSNIRGGITTRPEGNTLVYADEIRNVNFSSLDIRNSIGDGITAQRATRMSIQNCNIFDNSTTYQTFDSPLQATDATVLKVSDSAFLSNPGPVDITTSEVVAFNSCIIRNSGTGLRVFGSRSANTENNLILGPDDEWIPTEDIYDSDFNSVNITCDKTTGTGTGGPIRFTYVEENVAKDLSNTVISTAVYKIKLDNAGNELIDGGPLVYRLNDVLTNPEISVLNTQIYDQDNGGVQIEIPNGRVPDGLGGSTYDITNTTGKAVHVIPFRKVFEQGLFQTNYNYLVYTVVGDETVAVGGADDYMIESAVDYDGIKQRYIVAIRFENLADFGIGDIVTLREHNTEYSLPPNLTVAEIVFSTQVNLWTLELEYVPNDGSTFNDYHVSVNQPLGLWDPNNLQLNAAFPDPTKRGYIEKKRSFTIAKGIIGVV